MASAPDIFQTVIEHFSENSRTYSRVLHRLAATDPPGFFALAAKALLEERELSRGLEVAGRMLASDEFLGSLLEFYEASREDAIQLTRKLLTCEPQLEFALLDYSERAHITRMPAHRALSAAIAVLDEISTGPRLVSRVLRLVRHPDSVVRSKAAIFISRRTENLAWVTNRFAALEPRVRANVLEGLHQMKSPDAHDLLVNGVTDQNNRVVANALLGLYLLGDTGVIPGIYDMADNPQSEFRTSSAWLMGKTGDPRFIEILGKLAHDPDYSVRSCAAKSLSIIEDISNAANASARLQLRIVTVQQRDGCAVLSAIVHDDKGEPVRNVPGPAFILRVNDRLVREYTCEERESEVPLDVAFVIVRDAEHQSPVSGQMLHDAIRRCLSLRRRVDRWTIVNVSAAKRPPVYLSGPEAWDRNTAAGKRIRDERITVEFTDRETRITQFLERASVPLNQTPEKATRMAVEATLDAAHSSRRLHLIFLEPCNASVLLEEEMRSQLLHRSACIHVLKCTAEARRTGRDLAPPIPRREDQLRELVNSTGGCYMSVDPDEFAVACQSAYRSVLNHYLISWPGSTGNIKLALSTVRGSSTAVCDVPDNEMQNTAAEEFEVPVSVGT